MKDKSKNNAQVKMCQHCKGKRKLNQIRYPENEFEGDIRYDLLNCRFCNGQGVVLVSGYKAVVQKLRDGEQGRWYIEIDIKRLFECKSRKQICIQFLTEPDEWIMSVAGDNISTSFQTPTDVLKRLEEIKVE